ncbi:MAG TPA: HAD family hydrolase [Bacteroidales bacterium]|nr:HAD family hydrolase [Bacteroidales bacterium]
MFTNTKPYKAVLFDLDGTLINSLHDIADSMNRVLEKKGYQTHDYDAYRYFIGRGLYNLVSRTLPESEKNEQNIRNLYQELLRDYEVNLLHKTVLYRGIPDLLDALVSKNIKLTILSNKADDFTKKIAAELLKAWPFDVVLGSGENVPRKPDPAGALMISEALQIQPSEFLYVGDTSTDMKTAIAAEMYPVGVTWGFRTKEELLENGACTIIDQPLELMELLK